MIMDEVKSEKSIKSEEPFAVKNKFKAHNYTLNLSDEMKSFNNEYEKFETLVKNPLVLGSMFFGLEKSMNNFNSLLLELNDTLKSIDKRIMILEEKITKTQDIIPTLSSRDQEIYDFVVTQSKACAEDVQQKFKYKGKHAASARLNKLFSLGLLDKVQSGRMVYYMIK